MYFTFVLRSATTGTLRVGITNNLIDRLLRYNTARGKKESAEQPWELRVVRWFATKAEAQVLESELLALAQKGLLLAWVEEARQSTQGQ